MFDVVFNTREDEEEDRVRWMDLLLRPLKSDCSFVVG